MCLHFAIAIKDDKVLGTIPVPYLLKAVEGKAFFEIEKPINIEDVPNSDMLEPQWIKDVVGLSMEFNHTYLNKRFNKNRSKFGLAEYLQTLDKPALKLVHNYIDGVRVKIYELVFLHRPMVFAMTDRWDNVHDEDLVKVSDKPANVLFGFEKRGKTLHYRLRLFHGDKILDVLNSGLLVLTNKSPCFLYENEIVRFAENSGFNGNKVKPFLTKAEIVVEDRLQGVFFEKFVKDAVKKFDFDIKGFDLANVPVRIKAVLEINRSIFGDILLMPIFWYNMKKVPFYSKQAVFVDVVKKGGNYLLESMDRDFGHEAKLVDRLVGLGLVKKDKFFVYHQGISDKYMFAEYFAQILPQVKEAGFEVENKLFDKKINYSKPGFSLVSEQKQDWFDLNITVSFGIYEFKFENLKYHILNEIKEFELPDSSIAIIPDAWFAELAFFAKKLDGNNRVSIHRSNYNLLSESGLIKPGEAFFKKVLAIDFDDPVSLPKKTIASLRSYQKIGFHWLHYFTQNNFGVCLADEMGLGKTLQVLTVLQKFYEGKKPRGHDIGPNGVQLSIFDDVPLGESTEPSLIVVPRSLVFNWIDELNKFAPDLSYYVYHGKDRETDLGIAMREKQLIITTYGILRQDIVVLGEFRFAYLILDESQAIKNPGSKVYKAAIRLGADFKVAMTGTPFENNLADVWSLMNFLNPGILGNLSYFKKEYINKIGFDGNTPETLELKRIISPFVLKRLKQTVAKELPEKMEQVIYCEMDEEQADMYETEKSAIRNELLFHVANKKYINALSILNRLRQIALHPKLVDAASNFGSGKYGSIVSFIQNLLEQGDKFLVFSSFVKHLEIYKAYFEENNIKYSMLTGKDINRKGIVDEYQNNEEIKPFLISIKAGGTGLNITSANYVLIIDPWWNPFMEDQAIDRAHRIGQAKTVFVYRFVVKGSIEDKIAQLQKSKRKLGNGLFGKDMGKAMTSEDFMGLLK
jgi:superfamily II DNA or RNA helicase